MRPRVTYIEHSGTAHTVEVAEGDSVMHGAVSQLIPGIVGECGGALACATCHCYVDEAWQSRVGMASEMEREMLEAAASEVRPGSRLSCQITMSAELDGLVVRLPPSQF